MQYCECRQPGSRRLADGNRLLIASSRDVSPTAYYILDVGEKHLDPDRHAPSALGQSQLARMKPVKIKGPTRGVPVT
jgi:hypothetical protein